MKILSSHLAMRFYRNCGWTQSLLESCLMLESELIFRDDWLGDHDMAYWVLKAHSHFNLEKLKPHITEIRDYNGAVVPANEWDAFLREFNETLLNAIEEAKRLLEKARLLNEEINRLLKEENSGGDCHDSVKPQKNC